jgi:hypothetical protein
MRRMRTTYASRVVALAVGLLIMTWGVGASVTDAQEHHDDHGHGGHDTTTTTHGSHDTTTTTQATTTTTMPGTTTTTMPGTTTTTMPGTTTTTAPPQPGECVTATNMEHEEAGRVVNFLIFSFAEGSWDFVGFIWTESSLTQNEEGAWERVDACDDAGQE